MRQKCPKTKLKIPTKTSFLLENLTKQTSETCVCFI